MRWPWLLALPAALVCSAPAHGAPPAPKFGFNDDLGAWQANAGQAESLKANTARIPLPWNSTDFAGYNRIYQQLEGLGIKPIFTIWGSTEYVPTPQEYAERASEIAQRYPTAALQIWNEPNSVDFGRIPPERAAALTTAAAEAIRSVNPGARIVGPSVMPFPWERNGWKAYIGALYRNVPRELDVEVGLNLYPYGGPGETMRSIERVYRRAARYGKVHVTEVGLVAAEYGAKQARMSARVYGLLSRLGARSIIFHRLAPNDASGWEQQADLHVLGNRKLARALRKARAEDLG
ncbi:MAG: hypothetical protein K0R88_1144 [Solirubrobacterales bacterium]|jgi:hypothetical protein|nr:hypothetical protein [Solirubrobacterales bacterium]